MPVRICRGLHIALVRENQLAELQCAFGRSRLSHSGSARIRNVDNTILHYGIRLIEIVDKKDDGKWACSALEARYYVPRIH